MLQSMKYDGNLKDHLKILDAVHVNVAALPFTYCKLNGKAPILFLSLVFVTWENILPISRRNRFRPGSGQ